MIYLLHQALIAMAKEKPQKVAFRCQDQELTYFQAATKAKQLAKALHDKGIERGDRVGIFLNRSLETAVAIHGIMLAGAAYVPLNPKSPASHVRFQLQQVGCKAIVTNPTVSRVLADILSDTASHPTRTVIGAIAPATASGVDYISWEAVYELPATFTGLKTQTDADLAYIMYTSGSTGKPKGMMHTHRTGLAAAHLLIKEFGITEHDRFANHAPIYFDISLPAYLSTPIVGATTIIATDAHTIFPVSMSQFIENENITLWYSVPLALTQMLEKGFAEERDWSSLRKVVFGGEPFAPKYLRRLMQHCPNTIFCNLYGPAETNGCIAYDLPAPPQGNDPIPIGTIYTNTEWLIIDEEDQVLSPPATGELLIGSITCMEGYFNRPDLNENCFYYYTYEGGRVQKFYRTGDLVSIDEQEIFQFLGRKDKQLKVRGYRVEGDAIERRLLAHPAVLEAAVFPLMDKDGTQRIEAAIILKREQRVESEALKNFAKAELPWYAVPEKIHFLDRFPRTGSEKTDRNALANQFRTALQ